MTRVNHNNKYYKVCCGSTHALLFSTTSPGSLDNFLSLFHQPCGWSNMASPRTILSYNYPDQPRLDYEAQWYGHVGDDDPMTWGWVQSVLTIVFGVIVLGTVVGNLSVLIHFTKSVRTRGLHNTTPTHFFIANLACSDFLVGVLVLPYLATLQVTGKWYFGQCFCTLWVCTHYWLCAASILSTCAICIERYIGVKYPIQHMRILNPTRIGIAIFCVWVLAGVPSIVRVFVWTDPKIEIPYKCVINQKLGHAILAAGGIFYLPASIMVVLYYRIYRIAMRHMNSQKTGVGTSSRGLTYQVSIGASSSAYTSPSKSSSSVVKSSKSTTSNGADQTSIKGKGNDSNKIVIPTTRASPPSPARQIRPRSTKTIERRQINLAKKLGVLVGVVILSYGPYFTLILLKSVNPNWVHPQAFNCFAWIRYFNSFLNPFIYAFAVPAFNQAFKTSFIGRLTTTRREK